MKEGEFMMRMVGTTSLIFVIVVVATVIQKLKSEWGNPGVSILVGTFVISMFLLFAGLVIIVKKQQSPVFELSIKNSKEEKTKIPKRRGVQANTIRLVVYTVLTGIEFVGRIFLIPFSKQAKRRFLGIDPELIRQHEKIQLQN